MRKESARHEQEANHIASRPAQDGIRPLAHTSPSHIPAHARAVLASPGQPLDPAERAHFEPLLGHDFSTVRIHDDARATQSAKRLNARAYTAGAGIVLRSRERDRDLLAHELTHVVQQSKGQTSGIQRKPWEPRTDFRFDRGLIRSDDLLDDYVMERLRFMSRAELRGYRERVGDPAVIAFIDTLLMAPPTEQHQGNWFATDVKNLSKAASANYWYNKTDQSYAVSPTPPRMHADPEEYDAVYAAFWGALPSPPSGAWSQLVAIPPGTKRKSQLLYRFRVTPAAVAGGKPVLTIEFVTEQPGEVISIADDPARGTAVPNFEANYYLGFDDSEKYFKDHPDVRRQLNAWLQKTSGKFDQVVITRTRPRPDAEPVETLFQINGTRRPNGTFEDLGISMLDDKKASQATLPADFHGRDYADLLIEKLQTNPHSKLKDKLGYVNVTNVPHDEVVFVKYLIVQYFDSMETRNAEVDVVVPIPGAPPRQIFYSLRFRADNEVDVERIGEKGSSEKLDPDLLDVARVRGYADHAGDPAKLKTWLGKRYKALTPAGATVEELRKSANDGLKAGASSPEWFKKNYTMFVLDGAATQRRLRTAHAHNVKQTPDADKKDFAPGELKVAELSLQTLTDTIIARLAAVRLGRKTVARKADGSERPSIAGNTFTNGSNNTVIMYDRAFGATIDGTFFKHEDSLFSGGKDGVRPIETADFTHEFAHVLEFNRAGLKEAFLRFVKRENIKPVTPYAASQPSLDFFTEAVSMYSTDPEWLRDNHISLYTWLDEYARTGKIPK